MSEEKGPTIPEQAELQTEIPFPVRTEVPVSAVLIVVDDWIHTRLRNTAVSHNTQIWNQLAPALDDLKRRIRALST